MNIAIVGCGYVFDHYMDTKAEHPELHLRGVFDRDRERLARVTSHFGVPGYTSYEALLADESVELVINLTNPESHFEVSAAALRAGKHVYSEKPLALDLDEAMELVALADESGVELSGAPCNVLGQAAQTIWHAIRDGEIGIPRVVYAELDDNPIYLMKPEGWTNPSGAPWPYRNEYQVGCTIEHAAYYISWLCAFFGPASSVTAFSSQRVADKTAESLERPDTADFSVAVITFASGTVARLTCSIVAPYDHRIQIVGDQGMLSADECWHYETPVRLERFSQLSLNARKSRTVRTSPVLGTMFGTRGRTREPVLAGRSNVRRRIGAAKGGPRALPAAVLKAIKRHELVSMDFLSGPAEVARSIRTGRRCALPADFVLHVTEIALQIQSAGERSASRELRTSFEPLEPAASTRPGPAIAAVSSGGFTSLVDGVITRLHHQSAGAGHLTPQSQP